MPKFEIPTQPHNSLFRDRTLGVKGEWGDKTTTPLHTRLLEVAALRGVEIPKNSRYRAYISILQDENIDLTLKVTAHHEVHQLLLALEQIDNLDEWRETIDTAVKYDSVTPMRIAASSRGRDALFELYVAGRLQSAGMPVTCGEPDIISSRGGFSFTIAAKRLKSCSQIGVRAKEARDQIERARMPGIIALDLTPLQETYYSSFPTEAHLTIPIRPVEFMDRVFEPLLPELQRRCSTKRVMGVIAFAVLGAISSNQHTVMLMPIHSGHRLSAWGSEKAKQMWEIVEALTNAPAGA